MARMAIVRPDKARRREDTGRWRAKAATATERTKYPTKEQLFHPATGAVWANESLAPKGSARSDDVAGASYFGPPNGLFIPNGPA